MMTVVLVQCNVFNKYQHAVVHKRSLTVECCVCFAADLVRLFCREESMDLALY